MGLPRAMLPSCSIAYLNAPEKWQVIMKNYTPVLVNTSKPKFTFKTFFLGSAAAKNYYYCARHKTDDIYILWIETTRFGTSFCFPCVLDEQGDAMVYVSGRGLKQRNANSAMIARWNLFVKPGNFAEEFDLKELTPADFHEEYGNYKSADFSGLSAEDRAALNDGEPVEEAPAEEVPAEETPAEEAHAAEEETAE